MPILVSFFGGVVQTIRVLFVVILLLYHTTHPAMHMSYLVFRTVTTTLATVLVMVVPTKRKLKVFIPIIREV